MNLGNFAIWLKCFWAVICPNWWTLGLLVAAVFAFVVMKLVYGRTPVKEKGAMREVGKRWQRAGLILFGAALAVYVAEVVVLNVTNADLIGNREKPFDKKNVIRVLYKAEHDFARYCNLNKKNMKDLEGVEKVKAAFVIRPQISYADRAKVDLARTFSRYLAGTPNKRFYPTPECPPDKPLKHDTVLKLIDHLQITTKNERHKELTDAAKEEFTAPENREALARLEALLIAEFTNRPVSVEYTTNAKDWKTETHDTNESIHNGTDGLRRRLIEEGGERLYRVFASPINPELRGSASFETHLGLLRSEMTRQLEREMETLLSTENFLELRQEIINDLESEPGFMEKTFDEQLVRFNEVLRKKLSEQLLKRVQGIIANHFLKWETEAQLYNDDQLSYQQLSAPQKSFNAKLVLLYKVSTYLHDLFWLVLLTFLVLFVFWFRGARIVKAGNPRIVKNKIHNA